ncbi:uncharacterized protein [Procambarus clarkii]|uniref:uncharacterized protein n=1 Tax=Procambarus clarkii TaxID=6728 RepID=UPI001E671729|nr:uncharacterized protein LOC123762911 [Procambarus clarkii]
MARQCLRNRSMLGPDEHWGTYSTLAVLMASLAVTAAVTATGPTRMETSMCAKTDPLAVCMVKQAQCAPLDGLLAPLLGTPDLITACANTTGVPLKSDFYSSIGKAVVTGVPSSLGKRPTSDPVANLVIRRCVLNATDMLAADGTLDRSVVVTQVALLSPPDLGAAVAVAATTCPEPVSYQTSGFIQCLKKACVASAPGPASAPGLASSLTSSVDY